MRPARVSHILSAAIALKLLSAFSFEASANDDWDLLENDVGCALQQADGDRLLLVAMLSIPGHADAGILIWQFHDPNFDISPSTASPVTLNFDSGVVDGYRVKPRDSGGHEIQMMTYELSAILDPAGAATTLSIVSGTDKAMFSMRGFGEFLPTLQKCAKAHAK